MILKLRMQLSSLHFHSRKGISRSSRIRNQIDKEATLLRSLDRIVEVDIPNISVVYRTTNTYFSRQTVALQRVISVGITHPTIIRHIQDKDDTSDSIDIK